MIETKRAMVLVMTLLTVGTARADGDPVRGETRFQECAACHKLAADANEIGPSLHGVFTRKAGELADFRFSPAMKRSGIVWTPETLEKYIADPQALCRPTACPMPA